MNRKRAMEAFNYWANQIYTPLGGMNRRAEEMRSAWAWVIDNGVYRKLPKDAIGADEIVLLRFRERRTP